MPLFKALATLLFISINAFSQPPQGTLQVKITPNVIDAGDSVWFEAGLFSAGLCPFRSTYTVKETSGISNSFLVLVKSEATGGQCATAFGFSGPQFHIYAKNPGQYTVRFDSASQFKPDMGDSARFIALPTTSIRKVEAAKLSKISKPNWRIDGRAVRPSLGLRSEERNGK